MDAPRMGGASGSPPCPQPPGAKRLRYPAGEEEEEEGDARFGAGRSVISAGVGVPSAPSRPPTPAPPSAAHGAYPCTHACVCARLRRDHLGMCAYLYLNGRFGNYVQLKGPLYIMYVYI